MNQDEINRRIEAASRETWESEGGVREVLRAAFPELFAGTHWLAPVEPTEEMKTAAGIPTKTVYFCDLDYTERTEEPIATPDQAAAVFTAMRDVHLGPWPAAARSPSPGSPDAWIDGRAKP